jgi:cytochrome c biogenesis protein CcdA
MSNRPPRNPFFLLTAILAAVFVVTNLAFVASMLGDPLAPLAQLLERHGTTLIIIEVVAILIAGLLALTIDRTQTRRKQSSELPPRNESRSPPPTSDF